jgi:aspartyl-tRNA(Asn)/glutamyl-tRNA(Gln) amidotransferase subunit A
VIGIPDEYDVAELSPAVRAAWYRMADWMAREGGARVVRVSLPHTRLALPAYYILAPAEAMSNLSRYDGVRYGHAQAREEMEQALQQDASSAGTGAAPARLPLDAGPPAQGLREYYTTNRSTAFGPEVQRRILVGSFVLSSRAVEGFYARAQRIRRAISEDFSALFRPSSSSSAASATDRVDVLLTPTAMGSALSFASIASDKATSPVSAYLNDLLTIPANLAGLPALSVPGGYDNEANAKDGGSGSGAAPLPLGLQLLGDYHSEGKLLDVAAWMQHKLRAEGVASFDLLQQRPQLRELLQTELKQ